ncbi:EutP/PduV family microcompartment system protein [Aneurinibacillus thermoaerophilus]|uniref:EutP/PduV family microcompartment system protein n=1 Tax=Aneurinibacillus thermoaerophilus TaxID=143495 RepID=UPI002E1E8111|nr:EutP/PduV family microcompartment system protein [Aneurinibacillus thermoaerophilus]MED0678360.1 EutP/PduV family microcompartment system protein [Aneurinibacillus thermoaerophilus]MED0765612.1 EutP/PduV family microcompartment system protein [Aneurinibacillus thermoaerophilus]
MQKKHRAMLIGAIGAGKSTLTNALLGRDVPAVKTQSLIYRDWIVDTPGEYTENPLFYKNIMATALEVTHVLFIQDATNPKTIFPPGFATGIPKLAIGVVTKTDAPEADRERAARQLRRAIPDGPIVFVSAYKNEGLEEMKALISCHSREEMKNYCANSKSENISYM